MNGTLSKFRVLPITCLWGEPDAILEEIKSALEVERTKDWVFSKTPLDLQRVYSEAPPKGGAHLPRFALWRPKSNLAGTVFLPDSEDGRINLMRGLNRRFHRRFFSVFLSWDYEKFAYCRFECAAENRQRRIVHVIRDRGWEFYEEGEVLPFEIPECYSLRPTVERLTPKLLLAYLKASGWDLEDEDFWRSDEPSWFAERTSFPKGPPGTTINRVVKY